MTQAEKNAKRNEDYQKEMMLLQRKHDCKLKALQSAPTRIGTNANDLNNTNNVQRYLTATEIVKEAEIIYQWIIK